MVYFIDKMSGVIENVILKPLLVNFFSNESIDAGCEAMAQYIIDNYLVI